MPWQVRQIIVLLLALCISGLSITASIYVQKYSLPFPGSIPWVNFGFAVTYAGLSFLDGKEHLFYQGKPRSLLFTVASHVAMVAPIVTAVIAGVYTFSTDARVCMSELQWKRWFRNKDEEVIRSVQQIFRCCGFNSMRDRAWPFPSHIADAGTCQRTLGFRSHCGPLWETQLQVTARLCMMASLLVHVLSILFLGRVLFILSAGEIPSSFPLRSEETRLLDPAIDDMRATFDREERQRVGTILP